MGTVENTGADEARRRAKTALSKVHLGHDPQMEKVERRAQAAVTLGKVVDSYLSRSKTRLKPRSHAEVERYLRKRWATLHERPLQNIRRQDVALHLGEIAANNGPVAANRARSALSALFAWAIGEGLADANPVVGVNKATDENSRERVLSDDELRAVWECAGAGDYGAIVRLLILTGQRREEVGGLRWSELDLPKGLWRIGAERAKNGRAHEVPLSTAAIGILQARERRDGRALVFGEGMGPFQGWSTAKALLDKRIAQAGGKGNPWRLHDLRRTVATRMADLGTQPHVIEAVLNHISGHKGGVAGIYNRAAYADEKRQALALWADRVDALASGRASNIVSIAKRAG